MTPSDKVFPWPEPLPEFENPPVSEVAFSVQFEPSVVLQSIDAVGLQKAFGDRYPQVMDGDRMQPLSPENENRQNSPTLQIDFGNAQLPRWLYFNTQQTHSVQVQSDRLAFNWRPQGGESREYPHYGTLRPEFDHVLGAFTEYVNDNQRGIESFRCCEIAYINPLHSTSDWAGHGELEKVTKLWQRPTSLPRPDDVEFQARYPLQNNSGNFVGRLYVQAKPVFAFPNNEEVVLLQLIARSASTSDLQSVEAFLDMGHRSIVQAFKALTTESRHMEWELKS